jgi:hypothetical protein
MNTPLVWELPKSPLVVWDVPDVEPPAFIILVSEYAIISTKEDVRAAPTVAIRYGDE